MISLLKRLLASQTAEPTSPIPVEVIDRFIDLAVNQFDGRLKVIPGYRKRLREPVKISLLYLINQIEHLPESIEITNSAYASDPTVHALFGSSEQIEHLFSNSQNFRKFADAPASAGISHGYALMIMSRREKRRPGQTLNGDEIRYDVMQDVVIFSEHHLAAVSGSELETRDTLCEREFNHLVEAAAALVVRYKGEQAERNRQRIQLKMEIKARQEAGREDDTGKVTETGGEAPAESVTELKQRLDALEEEIALRSRQIEDINDYLDLLVGVLGTPADFYHLEARSDRLDRANQKVAEGSGAVIPYSELTLGERKYSAILVKYPLRDLVDRSSIADTLERVYSS